MLALKRFNARIHPYGAMAAVATGAVDDQGLRKPIGFPS